MKSRDEEYDELLRLMNSGGANCEVSICNKIRVNGLFEEEPCPTFVAITLTDEDDIATSHYFKDHAEIESLIRQLRSAGKRAFGNDS